ncbi:hypothetical protein ACRCUN_03405 [Mycobacterium sp. LTG2003]
MTSLGRDFGGNGEVRRTPVDGNVGGGLPFPRPLSLLHGERLPRGPVDHTHPRDALELRVPARMDRLSTVRTVLAALATFHDLDLDAVADLRLAVDEACAVLIDAAAPRSVLTVVVEPHADALVIHASTTREDADDPALGGFSRHVLTALTDDVRTFDDDRIFGISLTTRRKWASAN